MSNPTKKGLAAAVALSLAAAVSACGSSSGNDDATSGAQPTVSATPTLTGEPVKIGLLNPNGGPVPQPGVEAGAEAAVKYVNAELSGIGGRPLELVSCDTDTTPESAQACANTFVTDKVVAVLDGYNLSSSAALPTLTGAKIPLVGMIAFDSVSGSKPDNRVFFSAPQASFLIGALQAFKADGKKSVTLALADTPSAHQTIDGLLPGLAKALDIEAKGIYFSPTNPNFTAVASAIAAGKPDVGGLMASPSEAVCTGLVKGLRQLNYRGTIFTAACTDFIKDAPEQAAGGALYSSNWLPAAKAAAPVEVQAELDTASRHLGDTVNYYSIGQFSAVVNLAKSISVGNTSSLTGESVLASLKGLQDAPSFLGPKISCGSPKSANCTTQMLLFNVQPDGSIKPVTNGWITPAPQVMKMIPGAP